MLDLLPKFYKARQLVLNTCVGSLATAKAYLPLPENHLLGGCQKHYACLQDVLP